MKDLYGSRWTNNIVEIDANTKQPILDGDGNKIPTHEYKLWCEKLVYRSRKEIVTGFRMLEKNIETVNANGTNKQRDMAYWPPSYAEFHALCKPYQYKQREALPEESRIELTEEQIEANKIKTQEAISELKGMFK